MVSNSSASLGKLRLQATPDQNVMPDRLLFDGGQERTLERIVLPLSGLLSWLAVLSGVLMALHVMGINIQPLLTVGGVSGVVVGLSAQSVVSNMISGVNLVGPSPCEDLLLCAAGKKNVAKNRLKTVVEHVAEYSPRRPANVFRSAILEI